MAIKPIPKLILIVAVVGAIGYGLTKVVLPKSTSPDVPPAAVTVVAPPEQTVQKTPSKAEPDPVQVAPLQAARESDGVAPASETSRPKNNVSSGDAGMNALRAFKN